MNDRRSVVTALRRPVRGLSLVELLVGLAIGLAVVAGAVHVAAAQLNAHRAAMLEVRTTHELHVAAERLHRALRRAGAQALHGWVAPAAAGSAGPASPVSNPYATLTVMADGREVWMAASRDPVEDGAVGVDETLGFRLADSALQMRIGAGPWQALTDPTRLRVTRLHLDLHDTMACGGAPSVRHVGWTIEAEARADPGRPRQLTGVTRVRNDRVDPTPCAPAT
ncbi:MAG: prepilin-type N-terminal cleavage/methylation domain-containing protein [Ideonella sp.]|nr:prepilin-type N-terminal cleavage/methylation domain-containing protein [Ideonella sp.]